MSNVAHSDWDFHVAADAIAGGDGSESRPFRSLTEARDAIRQRRIDRPSESARVLVGNGRY
ncbi:MAG: hypothetical protein CMM00_07700, partial [Rhodopirellula sp.]|nr:hypothetical protein [Rhodopirellula sp.]